MSFIINPYVFSSAASFSPPDISGLQLWLKADALALSDGDPVSAWADSSSNSNDAAQGTGGAQPTYKTNIVNSLPVVRFDGTSDFLTVASNAGLNPTTITIVAVVLATNDSGGYSYLVSKNFDGANVPYHLNLNDVSDSGVTTGMAFYNGGWRSSAVGTNIQGDGNFHVVAGRYDGSTLGFYLDGSLDSSSSYSGSLPSSAQDLRIGVYAAGSQYFSGDLAELIIYDTALSSPDMADVVFYLQGKYAI